MPLEKKLFKLIANTREEARRKVVLKFLNENFGTKNDTSKYEYIVETYGNYKVILKRPARINKGFDFIVWTLGIYYKTGNKRRHQYPSDKEDIPFILTNVKQNIGDRAYKPIKTIIRKIFRLKSFNISRVKGITFSDGDGIDRPLEILLLTIRWLFIEQDITYWNYSGRAMLMNHLIDKNLA